MRKLTLEIDIGKGAMETGDDVYNALSGVAERMAEIADISRPGNVRRGDISDNEGNKVGEWMIQ